MSIIIYDHHGEAQEEKEKERGRLKFSLSSFPFHHLILLNESQMASLVLQVSRLTRQWVAEHSCLYDI